MNSKKYAILMFVMMVLFFFITGCNSDDNEAEANTNTEAEGNVDSEEEETESVEASQEKIILKISTAQPADGTLSKEILVEPLMEKITELTDGRVEFEYYPAEQLGKAADSLSLTADGVADISYFAPTYYPSNMPLAATVLPMPGLAENSYQGTMAYHNLSRKSPMLETDFLSNGVRPVFVLTTPTYEIFTNGKELKVPEDLNSTRIRSSGGVATEALNFAEATPVQISMPDTFSGLDRGVIDGTHMDALTLFDFGLNELVDYATHGLGLSVVPVGFIINEDVYQSLPEDIQEAIMQAGEEVAESSSKKYDSIIDEYYERLAADGVTVYELTEQEKEQWLSLYNEFNDSWQQEQNIEKFDQFLELYKEEVEKLK